MSEHVAATVSGRPVLVSDVDRRETRLRASMSAGALPRAGTSEGRQLRRWLTQLLVTERVVAAEVAAQGVTADGAPTEDDLLPDMAARLEIGSVAASVLEDPLGRALYAHVTAEIEVSDADVEDYHARNPFRFAAPAPAAGGWHRRAAAPALDDARQAIAEHLLAAARRRGFRVWLDARRAALVELAPGYAHPGDPRQPDNTHKH
ncbi:MAG: [acyl-carrier-protein] S-malonyltransferase [Mycobacterium sp.]|nr:[acyl-carrier-protein] S-malonyltransferase [Mycobacterium sp.]